MKNYTSRFLKSVALTYMAFPLAYLLFAALLFDIPAAQCVRILLSPTFYILSFLAAASGYGLWEMKRWAWYVFLPVNILTAYTNAVLVSDYGVSHHKVAAFIVSLFVLGGVIYGVAKEVKVPYFLPRIRWWESNPRYKFSSPIQVRRHVGPEFGGEILDLSIGGCFIKTREDLNADERILLDFTVFGLPVHCAGVVVWRTHSTVTHPKGVGVKFTTLTRVQRRSLRAINQQLKKITVLYRSSRYLMSQEDFLKRMDELKAQKLTLPEGRGKTG